MKEIEIKVNGMMCNGCENRIQNALNQIEGIEEVNANHEDGTVKIKANENINEQEIKNIIEEIGFEIER